MKKRMRDKTVSLKSIAEGLGVSVSTVSRVLNGQARKYRIGIATEESVMAAAMKFNFTPNQIARSLRLNKTFTIGLLIPDIANPFFASIARNVAVDAEKQGYTIMLCDSQENTAMEISSIELMISRKVDGLVIVPVGQTCMHLKRFEKGTMPVVIVDRYFHDLKLPYVGSDNYGGALNAVQYLVDRGHRRIACMQGLANTTPNEERVRGYKDALARNKIPLDPALVAGQSFGDQISYIETKMLMKKCRDVTAVFALSNMIALGVIKALLEDGIRVFDDISMICFDDQPFLSFLATPLTAIDQDNSRIGNVAVQLLFDQINGVRDKSQMEGILLPTRLIERESVRTLS